MRFRRPRVRSGLEEALRDRLLLKGKRLGIVANQSSIDSQYRHILDLFFARRTRQVVAAFGPQHGIRGETQDNMVEWQSFRDPRTGLMIYSLYGETRKPTAEMLASVDALVFDLQDVGARYYTFIYTLALAMEACQELGKEMIVLDRPNPISGVAVGGYLMEEEFRSFVGWHPLPHRHGMTLGELALYFREERGIGCRLKVVPMKGWKRRMWFDDTGLPWVPPSPNIPTLDSAVIYPGTCLIEGTNLSEGRGTTRPFELVGAPWIQPDKLARRLHGFRMPGVYFRPAGFIPTFNKHQGQLCGGVQIHVLDRERFDPFLCGCAVLLAFHAEDSARFAWKQPPYEYETEKLPIDILFGTARLREMVESQRGLKEFREACNDSTRGFWNIRKKYLLYR
ncbi:MAG: DUF1343 domain-containing protein [Acidobacteria bacterium]|nr:DUF1343 domain-containing protein [Acidobacteriota bacterium]